MEHDTHALQHDPYLWLEDVASEPALGWVGARNPPPKPN
jgi:prolyl oligopeptidase PreP (S9A serine peptidase family)